MVQCEAFITKYQILSNIFNLKDDPILIAEKCSLEAELVVKSSLHNEEREVSVYELRHKKDFQNVKCFM